MKSPGMIGFLIGVIVTLSGVGLSIATFGRGLVEDIKDWSGIAGAGAGIGAAVLGWIFLGAISGRKPGRIAEGADGRPSTSKFQFALWTAVVLSSYVALVVARGVKGDWSPINDIPRHLLIAMGLSATTAVAAKGITTAFVANGDVVKPPVTTGTGGLKALFLDDSGVPDLSKIQLLAWTAIAVVVYLFSVAGEVGGASPKLPDIDSALMVLMGLGQGAYLGRKLTSTTTPRLLGLEPSTGNARTVVTITGSAFGATQDGGQILAGGTPLPVTIPASDWTDTAIKFAMPPKQPNGADWSIGVPVTIGVVAGGQVSANTLAFTFVRPIVNQVAPLSGPAGTVVTLFGAAFGSEQGENRIMLDGTLLTQPIAPDNWKNTEVTFTIPNKHPNGPDWQNDQAVSIGVSNVGQPSSNTQAFTIKVPPAP